jgi:hypothetical protein
MNLFGLERAEIEQAMLDRWLPAFGAADLPCALARGLDSFEGMTDLPKGPRRSSALQIELKVASQHVPGTAPPSTWWSSRMGATSVRLHPGAEPAHVLSPTQVGCPSVQLLFLGDHPLSET